MFVSILLISSTSLSKCDVPLPLSIRLPFFHASCHSPPLSLCLPFSKVISHYQRCHVREWVFWGSRGVCLHLHRGQLNLRLLFETHSSKSLPPHTLPITHSMPLTKLYIYRAVDGRRLLFSCRVYLTYGKKTRGLPEAQCGPLVTCRGNADALQRFSSLSPAAQFCGLILFTQSVPSLSSVQLIQERYCTQEFHPKAAELCLETDGSLCWWASFLSQNICSVWTVWKVSVPNQNLVLECLSRESMAPNPPRSGDWFPPWLFILTKILHLHFLTQFSSV